MGRTGVAVAVGAAASEAAVSGCMVVLHFGQRREGMGASNVSVEPQFGQTCLTDIGKAAKWMDKLRKAPSFGGGAE